MHPRDVILSPVISEKIHARLEENKYTFRVIPRATKVDVANAVESIFKVHVEQVNMMTKRPKKKSLGKYVGKTSAWKKAIVTVKKGQKIPGFFEGM